MKSTLAAMISYLAGGTGGEVPAGMSQYSFKVRTAEEWKELDEHRNSLREARKQRRASRKILRNAK